MSTKHTPGPFVVDFNTEELPFRVYSKTTQGNVGYFHSEADANMFAATSDLLTAAEIALTYIEAVCLNTTNTKKRNNYADAASIISSAIAKAKGEA